MASIPALVTSTESAAADFAAARAAGANYYLVEARRPRAAGGIRADALRGSAVNEFLQQFVIESRELADAASDGLLALEASPRDAERLDEVFRAFHTLKGGAAIVEFPAMESAMHAAEEVLAEARAGTHPLTSARIGSCLSYLDQVSRVARCHRTVRGIASRRGQPRLIGRRKPANALPRLGGRSREETSRGRGAGAHRGSLRAGRGQSLPGGGPAWRA